jgi:hypothetical protein
MPARNCADIAYADRTWQVLCQEKPFSATANFQVFLIFSPRQPGDSAKYLPEVVNCDDIQGPFVAKWEA